MGRRSIQSKRSWWEAIRVLDDCERLEVDYVVPVSKGGGDDMGNLVTACRECNSGKRAHVIGEPRRWSK